MTMFTGINPKWWAYYWPHITQFPSFQSESKHTVQVETWELCQTLPLLLPASWQPLPWNKSGVLLRVKPSEKWWCLPCACNCSSWVSYQIFSRGSRQSQSKRPSCFFFFKQFQKDQNGNGSFGCQDRPVLRSWENPSQYVGTVKDCKVPKQKTVVLYHNHWPKKNSADVMKDRQSINLICAPCWIAVSSF
jgi:hypothetical protein